MTLLLVAVIPGAVDTSERGLAGVREQVEGCEGSMIVSSMVDRIRLSPKQLAEALLETE